MVAWMRGSAKRQTPRTGVLLVFLAPDSPLAEVQRFSSGYKGQ
jgi:hypothetical protein